MPDNRRTLAFSPVGWRSLQAALFLALLFCPTISAQPRATLRGQVTDVTGAFVASGTVRLFSEDRIRIEKTSPTGEFEFKDVPFGTYDADATAPGFPITTISEVKIDNAKPQLLSIKLRIGFTGMECFERSREIRYEETKPNNGGRVSVVSRHFQSPDSPIIGATVTLFGPGSQHRATGRTGETGAIEFRNLPPGKYEVRLTADGFTEAKIQNIWVTRHSLAQVRQDLLEKDVVILCQ